MNLKKKKIKIILITVNRSDYGIQKNLIKKLNENKNISFKLVVSGSHLDTKFGLTKNEIIADNVKIDEMFNVLAKKNKDSEREVLYNLSVSIKKFTEIYIRLKPDIIIILGDRYEMLSAAIPSIILNIPVAHIHGGELTYGSFDDSIRHCITKIAKIHFVCHEKYKKRVVQMGEDPSLVFNVGSLSVENISKFKLFSKKQIEKKLKIKFSKKNILIAFHPLTTEKKKTKKTFLNLIKSIEKFKYINFFFSYPSPDPGNLFIREKLKKLSKKNSNFYLIKSFGQNYFHSMLNEVDAIIGNSSSGIIEAPSFNTATINIGNRQKGREQSNNIINSSYEIDSITNSIKKIYSPNFKKILEKNKNIFYKKNTANKIINVLSKIDLKKINQKKFKDLN